MEANRTQSIEFKLERQPTGDYRYNQYWITRVNAKKWVTSIERTILATNKTLRNAKDEIRMDLEYKEGLRARLENRHSSYMI